MKLSEVVCPASVSINSPFANSDWHGVISLQPWVIELIIKRRSNEDELWGMRRNYEQWGGIESFNWRTSNISCKSSVHGSNEVWLERRVRTHTVHEQAHWRPEHSWFSVVLESGRSKRANHSTCGVCVALRAVDFFLRGTRYLHRQPLQPMLGPHLHRSSGDILTLNTWVCLHFNVCSESLPELITN